MGKEEIIIEDTQKKSWELKRRHADRKCRERKIIGQEKKRRN